MTTDVRPQSVSQHISHGIRTDASPQSAQAAIRHIRSEAQPEAVQAAIRHIRADAPTQ